MKARILIFLAVVSLLLVITPAVSQVIEARWTANVPFDFVVGDTQMPAGEYMVKSNPHTMRLTVINKETQQKAFVFTHDIENLKPNEKTVLIFQQDGALSRKPLRDGARFRRDGSLGRRNQLDPNGTLPGYRDRVQPISRYLD